MTTKRKRSKAVARSGVNYVRMVVENCNCIFHGIDLDNDIGNDAHIEFIEREAATGCLIAVQVKSGRSYFRDPAYARVQSDRTHFEYWASHSLPVAMVAYDPDRKMAVWCDVTGVLMQHPERVENGPYTIEIPISQRLEERSFERFFHHFAEYRKLYRKDSYLGRALRDFANVEDAEACTDGLFSLLSFHKDRIESWYYIINCFRNFCGHPAVRDMIIALCHIPGHPDIFWHKRNVIEENTRAISLNLMASQFGRVEVLLLLSEVDENGIARGTIGQCAHAIIDVVGRRDSILREIAFDGVVSSVVRYWALVLLLYYKQEFINEALAILREYKSAFPDDEHWPLVETLWDNLNFYGGFTLY